MYKSRIFDKKELVALPTRDKRNYFFKNIFSSVFIFTLIKNYFI